MRFTGIYKRSKYKSDNLNLHRFCISTDYPDIDRLEDGMVRAEGYLFELPEDTVIDVEGEWDAERLMFFASKIIPSTENEKLSLKMIKNIISDIKLTNSQMKFSVQIPKKILGITGNDILKYVKHHEDCAEICKSLPKVDPEKIDLIYKRLRQSIASYEVIPYLTEFGISAFTAEKIARKYGPNAIGRIKKHPYMIGNEFDIPFTDCDKIGKKEGVEALSDERISALLDYSLRSIAESSGSTYTSFQDLMEWEEKITKKSAFPESLISQVLLYLILENDKKFYTEYKNGELRVSLSYFRKMERECVKNLKRLEDAKTDEVFPEEMIEDLERDFSITYGENQKEALRMANDKGVLLLTGGPGTGKTTVIRGFVELYRRLNPKSRISLCAPTGRAAQRMSDVVKGLTAQTVHKLLDIRLFDTEMVYKNKENPIPADLIIVDEASMLDIEIFSKLLPAIKTGSTLLMVGDEDQLKSVGPGNVLHDLLRSEKFRTVRLNKGYRQKSTSSIVSNAHKILEGDCNLTEDEHFEILRYKDEKEASELIVKNFKDYFDFSDPMKTQILSSIKKNELGTVILNHKIKETYKEKEIKGKRIEKGDKVIFTRNNYEAGYFNGDMGIVTELFPEKLHINVNGNILDVKREEMQDVQLAYAVTIHKSQGSEYNTVIIVLPEKPRNMLTKNILYTAITRAKEKVVLITTQKAIEKAVNTEPILNVKTNFGDML